MRKLFYSLLVLSFCFSVVQAEYFYLKSGTVVNGRIVSETDDSVTVSISGSGKRRKIMIHEIDEITKNPKPVPAVTAKNEKASDAEKAKTQFTSDLKQEKNDGDTYIKDNKSGVLVFNVKEAVIAKPKADEETQAQPDSAQDEEFDAALFLLGSSASAVPASEESAKTVVAVSAENQETAKSVPVNDDDFDAALFLLSGSEPAPDPLEKKESKSRSKQSKSDDYYDPALFLLEEHSVYEAEDSGSKKKAKSTTSPSDRPDNETFLAVAFDLKGVNIFSGSKRENGIQSSADKTEDSDYGISLSAEQYGYLSRYAAIGLGIGFQFKRSLEESPGRFGFLPLYAAFKMRLISEKDYHVYAVGHFGYNFLLANSSYLDQSKANGGLYYAGGLGASYNRYVLQVLYSVSNGSIQYSNSFAGNKVDKDVMYSKVGFYIGYLL